MDKHLPLDTEPTAERAESIHRTLMNFAEAFLRACPSDPVEADAWRTQFDQRRRRRQRARDVARLGSTWNGCHPMLLI